MCYRMFLAMLMWGGLCAAKERVSFPTEDGGTIYGNLYGESERAVVLAHGGRFTLDSWDKQARSLEAAGFRVLSIEFRGERESHGGATGTAADEGRHLDILGAIRYLRKSGSKQVSVVGASMGGDYAVEAAEVSPAAIDRLVLLSAGAYTTPRRMKGPKLYIISREDANAAGPRLPKILARYRQACRPKKLVLLGGSAHAQFLFETRQGDRVVREILQFLLAP